jgi:hypothetical protein
MDKKITKVIRKQRKKEREERNKNRAINSHSVTNKTI